MQGGLGESADHTLSDVRTVVVPPSVQLTLAMSVFAVGMAVPVPVGSNVITIPI